METCTILNSRKRVIVALVHTVVFFTVATVQVWTPLSRSPILTAIYAIASAILAILVAKSGPARERLYFACCMSSAGLGLARQVVGDPAMYSAVYLRVLLLGAGTLVGLSMLRESGDAKKLGRPLSGSNRE